jgi:Restriction Endonuclease associating with ARP
MGAKRELQKAQRRWAHARGLMPDTRGYLSSVEANLFTPMAPSTLADFERGAGTELEETSKRPAKMRALHSSAALVVNVFDHFVRADAAPLLDALGLPQERLDRMRFEAQCPTGLRGNPPNLDVVLELASGMTVGIESKFTEWLVPKRAGKPAFKEKYFEGGVERWRDKGLPKCQQLAADLVHGAERFRFLDAPQLLKHALGLASRHVGRFALYYCYFDLRDDAPGKRAQAHRQEIARFEARVGAELRFEPLSYRAMFRALEQRGDVDSAYLGYLRERYFSERSPRSGKRARAAP